MFRLEGVTKEYRTGAVEVRALRGVDLTVEPGWWPAVIGPSGSGKSTLLHIMGCLDTPTSGSFRFVGTEVGGMSEDALAAVRNRQIGFVFQSFNLLPRTPAVGQVMLPLQYLRDGSRPTRSERERRSRAALASVGVTGVMVGVAVAKIVDLSGLMRAAVSPMSIALALGAALTVGLFFGIYSAGRAADLSPIEALRHV